MDWVSLNERGVFRRSPLLAGSVHSDARGMAAALAPPGRRWAGRRMDGVLYVRP